MIENKEEKATNIQKAILILHDLFKNNYENIS